MSDEFECKLAMWKHVSVRLVLLFLISVSRASTMPSTTNAVSYFLPIFRIINIQNVHRLRLISISLPGRQHSLLCRCCVLFYLFIYFYLFILAMVSPFVRPSRILCLCTSAHLTVLPLFNPALNLTFSLLPTYHVYSHPHASASDSTFDFWRYINK